MLNKKENSLLNLIKYTPIVMIIILSSLIIFLFINENKNRFNNEIEKLKKDYFTEQKIITKNEVNKVYDFLEYKKALSEKNLKKQLKNRVYEAYAIAMNIYEENKHRSKSDILKLIKDALRDIRFNENRGYYFIHNEKGDNLLYPLDRSVEGNNYANLKDINGYLFVRKIMKTIKNKTESFDTYYWSKPTNKEKNRIFKKIAFYKYFEPLNISISTGEYLFEYEKILKQEALEYIENISKDTNKHQLFILNENGQILTNTNNLKRKLNMDYDDKLISTNIKTGFYEYKDQNSLYTEKITYTKLFQDWNWLIGAVSYTNEIEKLINEKKNQLDDYTKSYLSNSLAIILLVNIILLIISIYYSKLVEKKFTRYKNKILQKIKENREKDNLIAQQAKMAAMGEMMGNIAHQWRQPLSLISTSSSALKLKQSLGLVDNKEIETTADTITNTTKHLSQTIDDFRNFFQPNKDYVKTTTVEFWDKTYNLIKDQYKFKGIHIITCIEEKEVKILESELIQVILNILNNARDEFEDKTIDKKLIFFNIKSSNNTLYIDITDNAGGIPSDIINRIFEPYFTTKHKAQGTGIGLYMSQEIIRKHMNGNITVYNKEYNYKNSLYKGARFSITLDLN